MCLSAMKNGQLILRSNASITRKEARVDVSTREIEQRIEKRIERERKREEEACNGKIVVIPSTRQGLVTRKQRDALHSTKAVHQASIM